MDVVRSNRTESLVDALAARLRVPPRDPFAPDVVVVQSLGMARWLSHRLAERLGVWAGAEHPFPRKLVDDLLSAVLGPPVALDRFCPPAMTWWIAEQLPVLAVAEPFGVTRRFLADDPHGLKRYQLAAQLADLFDQYSVYRPDRVLAWEEGADADDWQACLWRALVADRGGDHLARRLLLAAEADWRRAIGLPDRLFVFGVPTLPPAFLRLLAKLAEVRPVMMFALAATPEYQGGLLPRRQIAKKARKAGRTAADLHLEEGNALLASLGRLGRELQELLEDIDATDAEPAFVEPPPEPACSTLQLLQHDLYHVVARKPETGSRQGALFVDRRSLRGPVRLPDDRSVQLQCRPSRGGRVSCGHGGIEGQFAACGLIGQRGGTG